MLGATPVGVAAAEGSSQLRGSICTARDSSCRSSAPRMDLLSNSERSMPRSCSLRTALKSHRTDAFHRGWRAWDASTDVRSCGSPGVLGSRSTLLLFEPSAWEKTDGSASFGLAVRLRRTRMVGSWWKAPAPMAPSHTKSQSTSSPPKRKRTSILSTSGHFPVHLETMRPSCSSGELRLRTHCGGAISKGCSSSRSARRHSLYWGRGTTRQRLSWASSRGSIV
mmetsp:Transcript_39646/g.109159  ORF Transcript_39646/g.109159 Transcript_39646/m.109159 type:complete len:223 (-) Transcript_39646:220-888(-)